MSRVGKKPIPITDGVSASITGNEVVIKGSKGELKCQLDTSDIQVEEKDGQLFVTRKDETKENRAKHGLYRALIANMVEGVTNGYQKELELVGVGFRVQQKGKALELSIGYSHTVPISAPDGIELKVEGTNKIIITGIDKQLVGQVAADIKKKRKKDPYKGKGIKFVGEHIRRKQGKTVKK